jgi:hypothetical protein
MLAGASPIAMTFSVLMDFERSRSTRGWFCANCKLRDHQGIEAQLRSFLLQQAP